MSEYTVNPPALPLPPATSKLAIWSLVAGITSFLCIFFTGIPAVIMGIVALSKIKGSNGALKGEGLAIGGIVTGILCAITGTAMLSGMAAPLVLRQRMKADTLEMVTEMGGFYLKAKSYHEENGRFPEPPEAKRMLSSIRIKKTYEGDWIYYPETPLASAGQVLLVSPTARDGSVLLFADGKVGKAIKTGELERIKATSTSTPVTISPQRR